MAAKTLSIKDISDSFPSCPTIAYDDDFFILDIPMPAGYESRLSYPCRIGGLVCAYCLEGEFKLCIGMDSYIISKDCFAISLPWDIVSLSKSREDENAKLRLMAISDRMLHLMEFDYAQAQITYRNRLVRPDLKYRVLIHRFRDIIGAIIFLQHPTTSRSLGLLLKSLTIEMNHIWEDLEEAPLKSESRSSRLTEEFVSLVARHHIEQRELHFYAGKLGLTPKYLSAAVKKASGKSAVEWISNYIILEAKFYLKHTSMNVKQIAYELNFDSHAEFYSYFKRHTGLSPTEYREQ